MGQFLVIGDVGHIQDVFAAGRLRAIRGASALVDSALQTLPKNDSRILRQQGGQVVALLDNADVDTVRALCAK